MPRNRVIGESVTWKSALTEHVKRFVPFEGPYLAILVMSAMLVVLGVVMLADDLQRLATIASNALIKAHVLFRLVTVVIGLLLLVRASRRQSRPRDMAGFFVIGMLYAAEGSLFNIQYYFAFVQIAIGYAWLNNLPFRVNLYLYASMALVYGCFVEISNQLGIPSALSLSYNLIATSIVTTTALACVALRHYWQNLSEHQVERRLHRDNHLADLGRYFHLFSADFRSLLDKLKLNLYELGASAISKEGQDRLQGVLQTLESLLTMQHFIDEIGTSPAHAARPVNGAHLAEIIGNLLDNLLPTCRSQLTLDLDHDASYVCSPSALTFSMIHGVSFRARLYGEHYPRLHTYRATISIKNDADNRIVVEITDNGPAISSELVTLVCTDSPLADEKLLDSAPSLAFMKRYVTVQGGTIQGLKSGSMCFVLPGAREKTGPQEKNEPRTLL